MPINYQNGEAGEKKEENGDEDRDINQLLLGVSKKSTTIFG
jgi:hypothetical protein